MEKAILPPGSPVRQFSVMLPNRAGALASLVALLESYHIVVLGVCIQDAKDLAFGRFIFSDPDAAEAAFIEKGIPYVLSNVIVIAIRHLAEDLPNCLNTLFQGETNIDFLYSLSIHPKGQTLFALRLEDYHFGLSMLHQAGINVFYQEDLSR